jgi:stalled ribosome rescue protein Dom34
MTQHAAVWIDHNEARVFYVDGEGFDPAKIQPHHHLKRHPNVTAEHSHPADQVNYFTAVEKSLANVDEILVVGPGSAKLELIKHVHKSSRGLEAKIVGVETVDHPTDGQLVAYVRKYFHAKDRLLGTVP